ncbi:opioid growth factor receptor conserved region-domain-containing protein [Boletus edulis BED1]|uniref:Opioid growth factor receptor conserved region-domain-containing protein n=1 Tax=Boletus edulis BED1 TaxID=1328754 RepID=A0AAD4BZ04_BOLED|nr:opioid growth factor receptor conserved region-domain-containing protein [Boletus edulis BED1]
MSTDDYRVPPRDIAAFLTNYPSIPKSDHVNDPSANYLFYLNRLRCQPDNLLIEEIHSEWYANCDQLEWNHAYIQWLFPIQEEGMNVDAYRLLPHEIGLMRDNEEIICRLVKSYQMMLDFYGMRMLSDTGLLGRSLPPRDFKSRYRHLLRKTHNNLRITRILKCLSELGMEHLNAGFLLHVLNEQCENGELNSAPLRLSMDQWWASCIRDDYERDWVGQAIAKVRSGGLFTREMYETAMRIRQSKGRFPVDMFT